MFSRVIDVLIDILGVVVLNGLSCGLVGLVRKCEMSLLIAIVRQSCRLDK